ncbi:MAG: type II toxin-antitoxin system VapC family toxin, partial [Planctomycetes bacterium]|nr:type II toxin-antitoxin system VapC family toxin [Planctomycetota bacterium]
MKGERNTVFVDTGAWLALALTNDPYHARATATWDDLRAMQAKLVTSIPVVIETFTFLDRNAHRQVATQWREQVTAWPKLRLVECTLADLTRAWAWFEAKQMHRLSAVDATSFTLMKRLK